LLVSDAVRIFLCSEFVRMIELLIGKPAFGRGLAQYYADFAYSNATTDDWIRSMERASGKSLMPMANKWLRRSGHPHVEYKGVYDANAKTYALHMKQTRLPTKGADRSAWILPVDWALVRGGAVQREGVFTLDKEEDVLTISDVAEQPDFVSFARGWSFFGTHANTSASASELGLQALTDPDVINRYFAYRAVTDAQKARIIEALRDERAAAGDKAPERGQAQRQAAGVSIAPEWVELHARILFDESVSAGARASILREGEDIHTRADLAHLYWQISDGQCKTPAVRAEIDVVACRFICQPHPHNLASLLCLRSLAVY
jgi:aminopeptidase N